MAANSFSKQYVANAAASAKVRQALKKPGSAPAKTGNLTSLKDLAKRVSK